MAKRIDNFENLPLNELTTLNAQNEAQGNLKGDVGQEENARMAYAAGTNNAIVAKLTPGTQITIYELTSVNGVSWGRTTNGWVCMSYVQLSGSGNVVWQ